MSLIRICNAANANKWDNDPPDFPALINEWFSPQRDEHPSLYWANSELEEVEIAAAHSLTKEGRRLDPAYIVRIEWSDLDALALREHLSARTPGITGLVRIDFQHWELREGAEHLPLLVPFIRGRYLAGENRFRWIGKQALIEQLRRFVGYSAEHAIPEIRRRSDTVLQNPTVNLARRRTNVIRQELQDTPPAIPEEAIRMRAFLLHKQRGLSDCDRNWHDARGELLESYTTELCRTDMPVLN